MGAGTRLAGPSASGQQCEDGAPTACPPSALQVVVKNDPDPEKGMGVEFSMQTITAITRGGMAHKEGLLRVGDIIEKVDGVSVRGKKVMSVIPEKATQAPLRVTRSAPTASSVAPPRALPRLHGLGLRLARTPSPPRGPRRPLGLLHAPRGALCICTVRTVRPLLVLQSM